MKTDPFDETLRRKLEGIQPPYQEKNWSQFQGFMRSHGFPPSLWQTPASWLQPALLAAIVAGLVIASVWQYQTNRELTGSVTQLSKTVDQLTLTQSRMQQSLAELAAVPTTGRVDTVYLTRQPEPGTLSESQRLYNDVAVAPAAGNQMLAAGSLRLPDPSRRFGAKAETASTNVPGPVADEVPGAGLDRLISPASATKDLTNSLRVSARNSVKSVSKTSHVASLPTELKTGKKMAGSANVSDVKAVFLLRVPSSIEPPKVGQLADSKNVGLGNPPIIAEPLPVPTALSEPGRNSLAYVVRLASHPFVTGETALAESWQRHLRQVRYRSVIATTTAASVLAKGPVRRTQPVVSWRVGVGAEVGTVQTGAGIYAEARLANRWSLSTGVSIMTWSGDSYENERLFMARTRRDFQRAYLPGGPPPGPGRPREAFDINRSGRAIAIPVQVAYCTSLGRHYTLSPFVGVQLSLAPRETVTFALDQPAFPRNQDWRELIIERPMADFSSWAVGLGVERRWGKLAVQASPTVLLPIAAPRFYGLNSTSVGVRARVFYEF